MLPTTARVVRRRAYQSQTVNSSSGRFNVCPVLMACLVLSYMTNAECRPLVPDTPLAPLGQERQECILSLGDEASAELKGKEQHSYQINLTTGQILRVVVYQQAVDVVVTLFGPDGRKLIEVDGPDGAYGPEPLSWIAKVSGVYRLEVRPLEENAKAGRYVAKVLAIRAATQDEMSLVAAEDAYAEAEILRRKGEAEGLRNAAEKYQEALPFWRALGNKQKEAATLYNLGQLYASLNEATKSLDYLSQALPLLRAVNDRAREGETLYGIGGAYDSLGQAEKALEFYNLALPLRRSQGDSAGVADTLVSIAGAYSSLGENQKALDFYKEALPLFRASGRRDVEAAILHMIGRVHDLQGELPWALEFYQQALELYSSLKLRLPEAIVLGNIGEVYSSLGEHRKAVDSLGHALTILRAGGERRGEAATLTRMGKVYFALKDTQQAAELVEQALALYRAEDDSRGEASGLHILGSIRESQGDKQKALELYDRALSIYRAHKDPGGEAAALRDMGDVHEASGEFRQALDFYFKALPLYRVSRNRKGEATALANIGGAYLSLSEGQKALDFLTQALPLFRAIGDRSGEAATLDNLGETYRRLDTRKALEMFNQALSSYRLLKDRGREANALLKLGGVHTSRGELQLALAVLEQALPLYAANGDRRGEALTISNLGGVYSLLGEKQKAFELLTEARELYAAAGDRRGEATALNNLGWFYSWLGERQKAFELFNQALQINRDVGDRSAEAAMLQNLARVHSARGETQKALELYNNVLLFHRANGNRLGEAAALHNIGFVYFSQGDMTKAAEFYQLSLPLTRSVGNRLGEAYALNNIARVHDSLGQRQKALELFNQALRLHREVGDTDGEGRTLQRMMSTWKSLGRPSLAIFYGKQAVNIFQRIRAQVHQLDKELEREFVTSKEDAYRQLAELLISEGRLLEAQQVLDLLKLEEFADFTHRAGMVSAATDGVDLTDEEAASLKRLQEIFEQLAALNKQYAALDAKDERTPEEEQQLARIKKDVELTNKAFEKFLDGLYEVLGKSELAQEKQRRVGDEARGGRRLIRELGQEMSGVVALHTLVTDDKYSIIMITPYVVMARQYPISRSDLNRKVQEFRAALRNPQRNPLPQAQELYRILVGPLAKELNGAGAETLMWSLDGVLRYVPMSALHDGKQYMVEKYRTVVLTPATRLKDKPSPTWRGVGMGVSKEHAGFSQLPDVPEELHRIIREEAVGKSRGLIPGKVLLDEAFTQENMLRVLRQRYKLVHIATHFQIRPGDVSESFLLLGDGSRMTLTQLRDTPGIFDDVELLTLSACHTAAGGTRENGREIDGIGMLAQQGGAGAVIASLWQIHDTSTMHLMQRFYELRETKPGTSKAEALRQAQLELLRGGDDQTKLRRARRNPVGEANDGSHAQETKFIERPDAPFAHPYFWAPFILIGNWR